MRQLVVDEVVNRLTAINSFLPDSGITGEELQRLITQAAENIADPKDVSAIVNDILSRRQIVQIIGRLSPKRVN